MSPRKCKSATLSWVPSGVWGAALQFKPTSNGSKTIQTYRVSTNSNSYVSSMQLRSMYVYAENSCQSSQKHSTSKRFVLTTMIRSYVFVDDEWCYSAFWPPPPLFWGGQWFSAECKPPGRNQWGRGRGSPPHFGQNFQ